MIDIELQKMSNENGETSPRPEPNPNEGEQTVVVIVPPRQEEEEGRPAPEVDGDYVPDQPGAESEEDSLEFDTTVEVDELKTEPLSQHPNEPKNYGLSQQHVRKFNKCLKKVDEYIERHHVHNSLHKESFFNPTLAFRRNERPPSDQTGRAGNRDPTYTKGNVNRTAQFNTVTLFPPLVPEK